MFFLFSYATDTISIIFASSEYLLILLYTVPYVLLIMVVVTFSKIEKQNMTCQILGLSIQIPRESRKFVVIFIFIFSILGIGILIFFSFMKFQGIDIHLLNPYPVLMPWVEKVEWKGELRTLFFLIIPHSVCALLIAPLIEEAYFTGLIFAALRNRLGFILSLTLTSFLFTYYHHSPFSEGQLMAFSVMFVAQGLSFSLYQFTRSLYPSIIFHSWRNMLILSLELSAFI